MNKVCTKCKQNLPCTSFYKMSKAKDGLAFWCKDCACVAVKKCHEKNKEHYSLKRKDYRAKNAKKLAEYRKEYIQKNKESINKHL